MDQTAAKQQIVERVKQANNILVTVNNNPSLDQLAACIGLTLLLNRIEKHATAIFSGKVPSVLAFLQPEKTIETNTDSLQDFIISLDKNKADKLRYKVENDVVRVFITPYKTSLSESDLVFSHGDFNVEVVIALGIKERTQIDQAIAAHGRILHDATVISVNTGPGKAPQLGQINWQDPAASSLSEMIVSISEAFGTGLLDGQMATSFLTGLVAETKRFSNDHTSPKVMTMAAQLMAAGANQQLIASKLEPPAPPPAAPIKGAPAPPALEEVEPSKTKARRDGALNIGHGKKADDGEVEINPKEIEIDKQGNLVAMDETINNTPVPPPSAPPPKPVDATTPEVQQTHALMDPGRPPAMSSAFTADTQNGGLDPEVSIDPLGSNEQSDAIYKPSQIIKPTHPSDGSSLDSARNAVEGALDSAPFDPAAAGPVEALNAQPVGPELHGSTADSDDTPSLDLPANGNGEISASTSAGQSEDDPGPAAPPPVPPPLPLSSNPGAMLPSSPSYKKSSDS